jgi:DNA modification methylase
VNPPAPNEILFGACEEVLQTIPPDTFHAIVTDPPYGLGDHEPTGEEIEAYLHGAASLGPIRKGRKHCANSVLGATIVPKSNDTKPEPSETTITFRIVVPQLPVVAPGVIQLHDQLVGEQKVNDVSPIVNFNDVLVDELDPQVGQGPGDRQLCLRERQGFAGCVEVCGCFTQLSPSTFRVLVRLRHDTLGKPQSASDVVATPGAEVRAVLRLDVGSRTGELLPTDPADPLDPGLLLTTAEEIGATPGACRLLTALQVLLTRQVCLPTDRTLTFEVALPTTLLRRFHSPRVAQKDFMGKPWEIPSVSVWKECFRVLKPGGYVLSFAGTRTWDIMSIGLRAAGFESRDTISSLFGSPCLQWLHGQGFPKSTNISKKLRERAKKLKNASVEEIARLIKLADLFEGFGTALKPAWEPVLCFRKPLAEETLADQVEATGTGGMNIDGTRIKHASVEDFEKHKEQVERIKEKGGSWDGSWKNSSDLSGASEVTSAGRWPPNVVLTHSPECKQVGTRKVPAPTINRFTDGMKPFGDGAGHPYETSGGGEEEIPVYECVEGCPVKALDEPDARPAMTAGDVSKYFPQFVPDAPFFYTGKASKKEKNEGLLKGKVSNKKGERRVKLRDEKLSDAEMERLVDHWPLDSWDPRHPQPEYNIPEEIRDLFVVAKPEDNDHPCLHPDALVMTDQGYRPIKDIKVGQRVLTADGTFHVVEAVTQHPYTSEDLFEIRVIGTNFTSLVTDNHPYLIWRPKRDGARIVGHEVLWVSADQVVKGDYTMTPIVQEGAPDQQPPRSEDTEFWFLVGLYLAEGCSQQAGHGEHVYPSFSLHENEVHLIDRIRMYCEPVKVSVYSKGDSKGVQVIAFDSELGPLCAELCGGGTATKTIHPCVWNLPVETLRSFVDGYLAGDGGPVRTYIQAKSASRNLASQMRFLAEKVGYKVEFQWYPAEPGHIGDRVFKTTSPTHVLRLTERNVHLTTGDTERKSSRPTFGEYGGVPFSLAYVKDVKRVPYKGDVVNLSVEGNHTFQTAVGMSHNTVKPVSLMAWLVSLVTPKNGLVLDPYCGSGTTCVGALEKGCNYLAIEKDPLYLKIAERRLILLTEKTLSNRATAAAVESIFANISGDED